MHTTNVGMIVLLTFEALIGYDLKFYCFVMFF